MSTHKTTRRGMLKTIAAGSVAASGLGALASFSKENKMSGFKGNVNHSVCRWTYSKLSVEELCKAVKNIGFSAIDLVGPNDWPTLKKHGVYSSMCNGAEINLVDGFNEPKFHDRLVKNYTEHI